MFVYRGEKYNFYVLPRHEAQSLKLDEKYIMVSISDPGLKSVEFREDPNRVDVLRLQFHDLSKMTEGYTHMSHEQANQVVEFILKYKGTVTNFVFHCEAGMCRSPGAAAAICLWLEHTDSAFHKQHQPNSWVKSIILRNLYHKGLI